MTQSQPFRLSSFQPQDHHPTRRQRTVVLCDHRPNSNNMGKGTRNFGFMMMMKMMICCIHLRMMDHFVAEKMVSATSSSSLGTRVITPAFVWPHNLKTTTTTTAAAATMVPPSTNRHNPLRRIQRERGPTQHRRMVQKPLDDDNPNNGSSRNHMDKDRNNGFLSVNGGHYPYNNKNHNSKNGATKEQEIESSLFDSYLPNNGVIMHHEPTKNGSTKLDNNNFLSPCFLLESNSQTWPSLLLWFESHNDHNPATVTTTAATAQGVKQLPNGGKVTLVGSGPGDPSLLTLAAHTLLQDPNIVVIADRLVSREILETVVTTSQIYIASKHPGCAESAQEEIYRWTYQHLLQGKHVVRLKIGDPFVFGRGAEEVLTFRQWGVESDVIPGISAALSAPLLGLIPVTHRGVANQVVVCTGYGREGTSPDLIRYHPEQTVVFLMAVGRLRTLCEQLKQLAGYPNDTPVAIIERAACPNQRTMVGTLDTIADIAEQQQAQAPSTIVVGNVVHVLLGRDKSVIMTSSTTWIAAVSTMTATSRVPPSNDEGSRNDANPPSNSEGSQDGAVLSALVSDAIVSAV